MTETVVISSPPVVGYVLTPLTRILGCPALSLPSRFTVSPGAQATNGTWSTPIRTARMTNATAEVSAVQLCRVIPGPRLRPADIQRNAPGGTALFGHGGNHTTRTEATVGDRLDPRSTAPDHPPEHIGG